MMNHILDKSLINSICGGPPPPYTTFWLARHFLNTFIFLFSTAFLASCADTNPSPTSISYTVTFDVDGGSAIASVVVEQGAKLTKPTNPTKAGYVFVDWFKDAAKTEVFNFSTETITQATTLYAKWVASYTVTFDVDGGSAIASVIVEQGAQLTKPTNPTKAGYVFVDWFKDAAKAEVFNFDAETITQATTIYAKWEKQKYTVTFDVDGGSAIASVTVEQGAKLTKPTNPTKADYVFVDWYKDVAKAEVFNFDAETITQATTIYAKWMIAYIQITENYLGIHSVYFDITVNDITEKETFGFIIAPATATAPTAMEVANKDGYITRAFSPTQATRSVFLFAHIATDMVKTFVSDEFQTSASKEDVLSPGTDYTLYVYKQNKVVHTHSFTTATFATASARTPATEIGLNGGLISSSPSSAPLVIEYKTSEFLFFPYNFRCFGRSDPPSSSDLLRPATTKYRAISTDDMLFCSTANLVSVSSFRYIKGFVEILSLSVTFTGALQPPNATKITNQVLNGTIGYYYNIKLITE